MTATPTRTATFLLRQPRQVQGFREQLQPDEQVFLEGVFDQGNVFAKDHHNTALTMLWIPPGRFWMGSPEKELDRQDREGPQHLVQLQGFFMGQTPITQAQWRTVAGWAEQPGEQWGCDLNTNPARFDGEKVKIRKSSGSASDESVVLDGTPNTDLHPVERVSWDDAREFCNRLSQRTGRTYTLPSEAQWEYACRAGSSTPFHFGPTLTPHLANYDANDSYADGPKGEYRKQTTPVGMFPANAWGLHDMHGNVWEWCLDHWHGSYEGAPSDGSAWLDGAGDEEGRAAKAKADSSAEAMGSSKARLLRGGSWFGSPGSCRSAFAAASSPAMPAATLASVWSASPRTLPSTLNPSIPQHWLFLNPGCWLAAAGCFTPGAAGASNHWRFNGSSPAAHLIVEMASQSCAAASGASGFRAKLPRLEALQIKGLDHAGGDRRELGRGEPAERALQLISADRGGWRHPARSPPPAALCCRRSCGCGARGRAGPVQPSPSLVRAARPMATAVSPASARSPLSEVGAFYWTVSAPDIVNSGREEQGSFSV